MLSYWVRIHVTLIISIYRQKVIRWILLLLTSIIVSMTSGCQSQPTPNAITTSQPSVRPLSVSETSSPLPPTNGVSPESSQATTVVAPTHTPEPAEPSASTIPTTPTDVVVPSPTVILAAQEVQQQPTTRNKLTSDKPITGTLIPEDGMLNDGSLFDSYEFVGQPGQFVTLTLHTNQFDAFLVLVDPQQHVLTTNDDGDPKAGTDARLTMPLPESGMYQVWVNANGGGAGEYTLQMNIVERKETRTELQVGQEAVGWLIPGDQADAQGRYIDDWTMRMPDEPTVVWLTSNEFDTYLRVLTPDGKILIYDDDVNFVAGDGNSRVVLAPSNQTPPGTMLTVRVSLPTSKAVGGAYKLQVLLLPQRYTTQATLQIRPFIIKGDKGKGGAQVTEQQIHDAVVQANAIWQSCGISLALADDQRISVAEIGALQTQMRAGASTWTPDETLLQQHPTHARYEERVITVYFVKKIDGGERYGVAYPSTRYAPSRSGLVAISDDALSPSSRLGTTLAHELGHILGLEHPNNTTGDGDPGNDTPENLMQSDAAGHQLTPLQCITARGDPHYLHTQGDTSLVSDVFRRRERVLMSDDQISDALTTQNAMLSDGQFIEVYYFSGRKGDQITLTLISEDFDPVLLLDGPSEERLALDDDSGGGRNARLRLTLPETGDYTIGVTSSIKAVGTYELVLESGLN